MMPLSLPSPVEHLQVPPSIPPVLFVSDCRCLHGPVQSLVLLTRVPTAHALQRICNGPQQQRHRQIRVWPDLHPVRQYRDDDNEEQLAAA